MATAAQNLVIPEKIICKAVRIIDFQISSTEEYKEQPEIPQHHIFSIAKSIAYTIHENKARYRLYFIIDAENSEGRPIGVSADICIEFHFEIENLAENITEADGQLKINSHLVATILGIAYSTSRGIILEKTQNTFLGGIILPCINPYTVLTEGEEKGSSEKVNEEK